MNCDFVPTREPDTYICANEGCGRKVTTTALPIYAICRSLEKPINRAARGGPGFIRKLTNFSVALAKHIATGLRTCTQEQIDRRFQKCANCELFSGAICTHEDCGCGIEAEGKFLNKIGWADQRCPKEPPEWAEEV